MSINDCSNEVSFKSAATVNHLKSSCKVGWSVAQSAPSPPAKCMSNALLSTAAPLMFLVDAIDLAKAFVYLDASLSYKLSSIASSVIANANAIVSLV